MVRPPEAQALAINGHELGHVSRVQGPSEHPIEFDGYAIRALNRCGKSMARVTVSHRSGLSLSRVRAGDLLWVQESFRIVAKADGVCGYLYSNGQSFRRVNDSVEAAAAYGLGWLEDCQKLGLGDEWDWHPPRRMSRNACRFTVPVLGVRRERLQDITPEQAIAEGIEALEGEDILDAFCREWSESSTCGQRWLEYTWAANPWVWVYQLGKPNAVDAPARPERRSNERKHACPRSR